jgi:hypothetical protein
MKVAMGKKRNRVNRGWGRSMSHISVGSVVLFVVLFGGSSCGKKGAPRAPELAVPQVIKNLNAAAGSTGIVLTWGRPTHYIDGQQLRDLEAFVIFRKELSPTCPDCQVPYRERGTILIDDQERFVKKDKFHLVDQQLTPQATYLYRVFSRLVDGSLSQPSNEVKVVWRP